MRLFYSCRDGINHFDVCDFARKELTRNGVDALTVKNIVNDLYFKIKDNCIKLMRATTFDNSDYDKTIALLKVTSDMLNTLDECYYTYHYISKHAYIRMLKFVDYIVDEQKKRFNYIDGTNL